MNPKVNKEDLPGLSVDDSALSAKTDKAKEGRGREGERDELIHLFFTPLSPFFYPGVDFPSPPALVNKLPYFPAFGCPYLRATTSSLISDGQPLIECQSYQQQDCPGSEIFQLDCATLLGSVSLQLAGRRVYHGNSPPHHHKKQSP